MATVGMQEIKSGTMEAGEEVNFTWNNPPRERVWQVTVVPSCIDSFQGSTARAEASLTWQLEQERTGFTGSGQTQTPVFKRRMRIHVKNEAGQKIQYVVFLGWIAP
jgi:hypothetical protein